jgi:hypothetical protein
VVRVPVREAHGLDGREPDAEPTRVLQLDLGGGSDVEGDRALFGAAPPRDQRREAVAGEARMPPGLDAVMAVLGGKMGNTRNQSPELSGSCSTPLSTLHSVSLSLSTTTSASSASSAAISTGFSALSCRLATLAAPQPINHRSGTSATVG